MPSLIRYKKRPLLAEEGYGVTRSISPLTVLCQYFALNRWHFFPCCLFAFFNKPARWQLARQNWIHLDQLQVLLELLLVIEVEIRQLPGESLRHNEDWFIGKTKTSEPALSRCVSDRKLIHPKYLFQDSKIGPSSGSASRSLRMHFPDASKSQGTIV